MKKVLVVIAQQGYQDRELAGVREALEEAGFAIVLASKEAGSCYGTFGGREVARLALRDVRVPDYDRIVFIGGPGAEQFVEDTEAHAVARAVVEAKKPLGAICIAPTILAAADLLKGKRTTVWDSGHHQIDFLTKHGAVYSGEAVTIDGLIVTGNGPDVAKQFGKIFAAL